MNPTDEELLHGFYTGNNNAQKELADRLDLVLSQVTYFLLVARTGAPSLSLGEWDIDDRLSAVWIHVAQTRMVGMGIWPHHRLSALTWLVHLLCQEVDRHLGLQPPF